ncbi:class I SAM-dependent methyltransferase [Pirellulaceae bacterium SH501]
MTNDRNDSPVSFDTYAAEYEAALAKGLSLSGESSDYFASSRVAWTESYLKRLKVTPRSAMDFGCGTGNSVPYLLKVPNIQKVIGVDPSEGSLQVAAQKFSDTRVSWCDPRNWESGQQVDFAFCNGVFHHIPPASRQDAFDWIRDRLSKGGCFALWENNPWNPGTRWVMSRIPFDRDAICLSVIESKRRLEQAGFRVRFVRSVFYFPKILAVLRFAEPLLSHLPLGAQYLVLAEKQ